MSDHDAIRNTLARYCQLCDDGWFDEWAKLYTEDATFHVMGKVYRGRDEIKGFIQAGQPPQMRGKHVATNSVIVVEGDQATARTDYLFVGRAGEGFAITNVGRYHDKLVRRGSEWLFSERRIVFLGDEPQGDA
ncbi:MAG TPA: nuclear transport factor 2 family protein [Acidimicrobiales bacterium]|jgi:3-phenylpropionate/cinnamic acid dioxygenase small subunit|nr:nuclear transport factor 2 family protein [Acidimicrobiales bacterium]